MSKFSFIFSSPSTFQPPYHCSCLCKLSCLQASYIFPRSFFATLQRSNLGLTAHPLANCLGPNPNGHSSPLTFDSLLFFHLPDSVLRLLHRLPICCSSFRVSCLGLNPNGHCSPLTFGSLPFFHLFDSVSSIPFGFPAFPSCNVLILPRFPPFSSMPHILPLLHFPAFFPTFFLPFLRDLGEIAPYRHHIA